MSYPATPLYLFVRISDEALEEGVGSGQGELKCMKFTFSKTNDKEQKKLGERTPLSFLKDNGLRSLVNTGYIWPLEGLGCFRSSLGREVWSPSVAVAILPLISQESVVKEQGVLTWENPKIKWR